MGDTVDFLSGFAFKSAQYTDSADDLRLLRGDNIAQGRLRWEGVKRWPTADGSDYARYNLAVDDVVLAMDRPWIDAGLKWAWLTESDLPALLVQRVARLRGANGLDTRYLRYVIGAPSFTDYVKAITTGVNVPHISGPDIKKYAFWLPPLPVQRRIADILSAYDDLIENNTRRIKILEEMARSLYREWFVEFRLPGHRQVRQPALPKGWSRRNLFELASITYGFPFKSKLFSVVQEGVPVVRIRDLVGSKSATYTTEAFDPKYCVRDGDLLIGMDGKFHISKWSGGEAALNQRVVMIRPRAISNYFLCLALTGPIEHLEATISGTTVAHLSDKDLRRIDLVVAPPDAQARFDAFVDPLYAQELVLKKANESLRETRDLLLPRLVSGEIEPTP